MERDMLVSHGPKQDGFGIEHAVTVPGQAATFGSCLPRIHAQSRQRKFPRIARK